MKPDIYDRIYTQLIGLIPDLRDLKLADARESIAEGFMPLHLDILSKTEEEMIIALSHNYQQDGDPISDPDMQIRVYLMPGWTKAEALTFQDNMGNYHMVYPKPGIVDPRRKRELNAFLTKWLRNLKRQGHSLTRAETMLGAFSHPMCDECRTGTDCQVMCAKVEAMT